MQVTMFSYYHKILYNQEDTEKGEKDPKKKSKNVIAVMFKHTTGPYENLEPNLIPFEPWAAATLNGGEEKKT